MLMMNSVGYAYRRLLRKEPRYNERNWDAVLVDNDGRTLVYDNPTGEVLRQLLGRALVEVRLQE